MSEDKLVLVTQNKHKIEELKPLFDEYGLSFDTTPLEKFEIRSHDIEEIAIEAAKYGHKVLNRSVVVDDTGFFVSALNDFPGSYAAYVLKSIGYQGILKLLEDVENRFARFETAVAFCDGIKVKSFRGVMQGQISKYPSGKSGFGYDPIFVPNGVAKTYADLELPEKIAISHRTKAFRAFLEWRTRIPDNP
ncbi:XTP/dITP diphosphatase [Candidatus Thorarchaeota archaeon]|nr:MAG: XTP/dITP diphosphatase [Candidatus Thorarchaeota archaeon]